MKDDMANCSWFLEKVRTNPAYAQNLYAAMCNMRWQKADVFPILADQYWSVSWRSSGGIVAEFRDCGEDYLNYYCSGMGGLLTYDDKEGEEYMTRKKFVPEGTVTDEIREDLAKLGWSPSPWPND